MNHSAPPHRSDTQHLMFHQLDIAYNDQLLQPRPWTEAQSRWAAQLLAQAPSGPVLELCAGAGHIGLGTVRDASRTLVMVDLSPVAQRFALHNAEVNGLSGRVEFRQARLEEALEPNERFALIVADPPWVPSGNTSKFPDDPVIAIDGGQDGLDLARMCVDLIERHLEQGGSAVLQLGNSTQAALITEYAEQLPAGSVGVVATRHYDDGVLMLLAR